MAKSFSSFSNGFFPDDDNDLLEIRKDIIRESLSDVYDKTQQAEVIATIKSVDYVNDSHSLTIYGAGTSLLRCYKPVTWIVGRAGYFTDYADIAEIVDDKVKAIICLDDNANAVFSAYAGSSNTRFVLNARNIEEAVQIASVITKAGEMVLFSPATENVDEETGKSFNRAVRALKKP